MPARLSHIHIPVERIELPPEPLSPWLRLAHRTRVGPEGDGRGVLRSSDDFMLMLQLEGTAYIWWHGLGGSVALPSGSVAFVPKDRLHAWGVCPGLHIAVHFDLHADPSIEPLAMLHHRDERVGPKPLAAMPVFELTASGRPDRLLIPLVTPLRRPGAWLERIEPLVAMYGSRSHRGIDARLRAAEILSWAVRSLDVGARGATSAAVDPDPRILRLLAELDAEPARPWSVSTLARRVGMGETAFRHAFARVAGANPKAHLEAVRMERAAHLLLDTDSPIAAIARAVGYDDPYHFSRVFKRVNGRSPSALRGRRGEESLEPRA